jgi:uncharacterized protein involved in exopolysaccharide biosynthesis
MTIPSPDLRQEAPGGSPRDLLHVLFKHQAKILAIFLATVVTVVAGSFLIAPVYEATASLLVKIGREYITKPEVGNAGNLMIVNQEEIINSEIEILDNRELIEKVIAAMGVGTIYPQLASDPPARMTPLEAAVLQFSRNLTVEGVKKSNVIDVSFRHRDPAVAAKALALLVDFFKEKHLEVFSNPQSSFLEKQLADYQQRLKESEHAFQAFKQQNQVYAVEEQRSLLLRQRVELDTALKATNNRIDELQNKVASYREQLRDIAQNKARYTQTDRDKIVVDAQSHLLSLQLKEQALLAKDYREDSRLVGNVRKEIQLVKSFLKAQEKAIDRKVRTGNPVYQEVEKEMIKAEAELASQRAGAVTITQQLVELDDKIQAVDQKQNELRTLQRELSTNEKNYQTYVEKLEEARISDDFNRQKIANISVIQAPVTPRTPVKPNKLLNIILGVLLGAVAGLGYAFFAEFTSQSFSTPQQVERRLGLPVLASITRKGALANA